MKNTSQLIGVTALLTFEVFAWPTQQMFALHRDRIRDSVCRADLLEANAAWKSVIITEIMADPSPPQGLPEVEYVELYNRGPGAVQLLEWALSDPGRNAKLSEALLEPQQYLVLSAKPIEVSGTAVMILTDLPSLNNGGDSLWLTDPAGNVIDAVFYSDSWYKDSRRKNGGWSLELIDVENTCEQQHNWTVADDPLGGSPGHQNSVAASNPDVTPPDVLTAHATDAFTLRVSFTEKLAGQLPSSEQWHFTPALDAMELLFSDSARKTIDLRFSHSLESGVRYHLVLSGIADCAGNVLSESKRISFALPEQASRGDIVLNEILFNPPPDGVDFVEVYNASSKFVDVNGWAIGSVSSDGKLAQTKIARPMLLPPGGYMALTRDVNTLLSQYASSDTSIAELSIPSFSDDAGTVMLLNEVDSLMDQFSYSSGMHNTFVRDPEGVSLERLSPFDSGGEAANWTSASAAEGFATPGRKNSAMQLRQESEVAITISPEVFTPLSGQPNFTEILYHFEQPGQVATVIVYDSRGVAVRQLANNALLGTDGKLIWVGDNDQGYKAQSGYYMVWFQVFTSDGYTRVYRKPVALSPRY